MEKLNSKQIIKQIKTTTKQLQDILNQINTHSEEFKFIDNYNLVIETTELMISDGLSVDEILDNEILEKKLLALLRQSNDLRILHEELFKKKRVNDEK